MTDERSRRAATKLPKIAIVVLIYNGEKYIERCLKAVFKSDYPGPMELVVVDNASTDESYKLAQGLSHCFNRGTMQIIRLNDNHGWAGGNNYGIAQVKDAFYVMKTPALGPSTMPGKTWQELGWDLALFLNDDTEIRPDLISELVKAHEKAKYLLFPVSDLNKFQPGPIKKLIGVFGCKLLYPDGKIQHLGAYIEPTGHTGHYLEDCREARDDDIPHYVTGAAIAVTRECWEACGPWPECYGMYYEEVELCVRARKKGFETICVPSAVAVHHADQREGRDKSTFYLSYERSRLRFVWRNYSLRKLWHWFRAEWHWYRRNIKGKQGQHPDAVRKAYRNMWWRLPWIWCDVAWQVPILRR